MVKPMSQERKSANFYGVGWSGVQLAVNHVKPHKNNGGSRRLDACWPITAQHLANIG